MTKTAVELPHVSVLHLEDNETDHLLVREMLGREGLQCEFVLVKDRAEFEAAVRRHKYDLVISDFSLPSFNGLKALALAQELQSEAPFIFFSGTMGEEVAVESLKTGAMDYVVKQRPHRLVAAVRRALQQAREQARRVAAEEKIHEQAALLDHASDAIIVRDLKDKVLYWNQGAERLYGWTAAEAVGKDAEELYAYENPVQIEEARRSTLEQGEWRGIVQQKTRNGDALTVSTRWTLVRDSAGKPKARLIINTDLTEIRKLESQLLRAQRLESIGALAGGIAHDLNNILAPILMTVDLIEPEVHSAESKQMLKTMQGCARRGADLVKQILLFARGTATETGRFLLKPLLAETATLIKDTFPRSIRIETNLSKHLPHIDGNPGQIHQVIMNLCVNARDAMPNGGVLGLALEVVKIDGPAKGKEAKPISGEFVVLSVSDSGHGMTPDVIKKIFDPFFTTKPEGSGTGLGLSTVNNIVKAHNGFVEVFSRPGQGTTFKIFLPAVASVEVGGVSTVAPPPSGHGQMILVVDDELAISEIMRGTLESYDYRVLAARSGDEALALYQDNRGNIQAVVMDMVVSVMEGKTLVQSLRQMDSKVKIIGISHADARGGGKSAGDFQVHTLLKKPYTIRELLTTLDRVLTAPK